MEFKHYKRKGLSEMVSAATFILEGGDLSKVSISEPDKGLDQEQFEQGFIARNPQNHEDMWYVAKKYFDENLEPAETPATATTETFFDRLVRERDELKDKVEKLTSFLSDKEKAIKISGELQWLFLHRQLSYMGQYLGVLNERIDHLETTVPSN